jgi:23S rRNA (adenine2503-C2)-methyltransferase
MIVKDIPIPTGHLFTCQCEKGELETLSIGDYGKKYNIKADFLGYTNEINGVPNIPTMPLSEKWVITLSTQYGCAMKCTFCDVPSVKFQGNASFNDLKTQLYEAIKLYPSVRYTDRMNIHFARMGEPILNLNVFDFAKWMYANKRTIQEDTGVRIEVLHPVLTTSLPRFKGLEERIQLWTKIKNETYNGQAGLQFSINSTNENQRQHMFNGKSLTLRELAAIGEKLDMPVGRKYCLNFAFSTDFEIDAKLLKSLFDPEKFMVKITPIHNNTACAKNGIQTVDGYETFRPYSKPERDLKEAGFDVLIFVPSMDEETTLVTCGNLVLSGRQVVTDNIVRIVGI